MQVEKCVQPLILREGFAAEITRLDVIFHCQKATTGPSRDLANPLDTKIKAEKSGIIGACRIFFVRESGGGALRSGLLKEMKKRS